jgi:hypothetical protein
MAVFGKQTAAEAGVVPNATCGCCGLKYCPPTISYTSCMGTSHYMWECTMSSGFEYCNCCERKNSSGTYIASGYQCQY